MHILLCGIMFFISFIGALVDCCHLCSCSVHLLSYLYSASVFGILSFFALWCLFGWKQIVAVLKKVCVCVRIFSWIISFFLCWLLFLYFQGLGFCSFPCFCGGGSCFHCWKVWGDLPHTYPSLSWQFVFFCLYFGSLFLGAIIWIAGGNTNIPAISEFLWYSLLWFSHLFHCNYSCQILVTIPFHTSFFVWVFIEWRFKTYFAVHSFQTLQV